MSEPACTHFDGESFLVRPAIRGPEKAVSAKLECPKCGTVWRPAKGEFWIHAEELVDLQSRTEAMHRENTELRQLLENAAPLVVADAKVHAELRAVRDRPYPDGRLRKAEPKQSPPVILRYDTGPGGGWPGKEGETAFRQWAQREGLYIRGATEYPEFRCWLFEVDKVPPTLPGPIRRDG
jgi:hypothetical protein